MNAKNPGEKEMNISHLDTPFNITETKDVLLYCDKEKLQRLQSQKKQRNLPVHKKMTLASRLHAWPTSVCYLRATTGAEEQFSFSSTVDKTPGHVEPEYITRVTKDIQRITSKSISDYIYKNRRILLIEHALQIKREEMCRMKETATEEEERISKEEEKLEDDTLAFNNFIKESDKLSAKAVQQALHEAKLKVKKMEQVKNINAEIFLLKSDNAKIERMLYDYWNCKLFLDYLVPQEFEEQESIATISPSSNIKGSSLKAGSHMILLSHGKHSSSRIHSLSFFTDYLLNADKLEIDDLKPVVMYFKEASELLKVISDLKEQILTFIQHSHHTRETLEEEQLAFCKIKEKMEKEAENFANQIDALKCDTTIYNEKADRLGQILSLVTHGQMEEAEKEMQQNLNAKVSEAYKICMGNSPGNMNSIMMLRTIENQLVCLLDEMDKLPKQKLGKVYRMHQVEKKKELKKAEAEERRKYFEERMQKAIERSLATGANKMRRRLMYHSQPSESEAKEREIAQRERQVQDEEHCYFFT